MKNRSTKPTASKSRKPAVPKQRVVQVRNVKVCCGVKAQCYDSRMSGMSVRRRHRCLMCGRKWSSVELRIDGKRLPPAVLAEKTFIDQALTKVGELNEKQRTALTEMLRVFRGFGKVT